MWLSSGILHRMVWWISADISKELTASINIALIMEKAPLKQFPVFTRQQRNIADDSHLHIRHSKNLKSYLLRWQIPTLFTYIPKLSANKQTPWNRFLL